MTTNALYLVACIFLVVSGLVINMFDLHIGKNKKYIGMVTSKEIIPAGAFGGVVYRFIVFADDNKEHKIYCSKSEFDEIRIATIYELKVRVGIDGESLKNAVDCH